MTEATHSNEPSVPPVFDEQGEDLDMFREAWRRALGNYWGFHTGHVEPQLARLRSPLSLRQIACVDIHYALCGLLRCLIDLPNSIHIQGVASCTRSIFELSVDQLLLTEAGLSAHRFRNFPDIEKLRVLRRQLEYERIAGQVSDPTVVRFVEQQGPMTDANLLEFWQTKSPPKHWSGIGGFEKRAERVGYLALYTQYYPPLSWFVHTATVGTAGLSPQAIEGMILPFLDLVRQLIPRAFENFVRELDLPIEDYAGKIELLRTAPLRHLAELKQR